MEGDRDLTQEERIKYLRERGVKIDFPQGESGESEASNTKNVFDVNTRKIRIVHVPADDSIPCSEVEGKHAMKL